MTQQPHNLQKRYKLVHNGRELSQGLLSEVGKFEAFQVLNRLYFEENRPDAIDPDEVEVIDTFCDKCQEEYK